jgi:hypothetical protein
MLNGCILVSDPYTLRKLGPFEWREEGSRALLEGLEEIVVGDMGAGLGGEDEWTLEKQILRNCGGVKRLQLPEGMRGSGLK